MLLNELQCAAELPEANAQPDHGAAQPAHRSSQPNPYFDEDDEELETYENEVRVLQMQQPLSTSSPLCAALS
jgi:hypothetical protein